MRLKNTLEDIVFNLTNTLLKDMKDYQLTKRFVLDITCYVLNRMKPRYIISSRGFVHEQINYETNPQYIADIISLIYEGIVTVSSRRKEQSDSDEEIQWDISYRETDDYYFNFPQIIGKVYDESNFAPLDNVSIHLVDEKGKSVEMESVLWKNPFIIVNDTSGIFTFWPRAIKSDVKTKSESKAFKYTIISKREGFLNEEKHVFIELKSEKILLDHIRRGDIYSIEPFYMVKS